jgi:nucleotide-binding universal stress UspA family protein
MMPTRGLGPFRRYLLGSVTAKVLHDAPCPVWTSVHREQYRPPRPLTEVPVLCAITLEPESIPLLQWAAEFARAWAAELRVLHVIPAMEEESENRGVIAVRRYLGEIARDKWSEIQRAAGITADLRLAGGTIAQAIASAAEGDGAGVLVIARRGMQQPAGGLRTQAYAIIRESPCPVIAL